MSWDYTHWKGRYPQGTFVGNRAMICLAEMKVLGFPRCEPWSECQNQSTAQSACSGGDQSVDCPSLCLPATSGASFYCFLLCSSCDNSCNSVPFFSSHSISYICPRIALVQACESQHEESAHQIPWVPIHMWCLSMYCLLTEKICNSEKKNPVKVLFLLREWGYYRISVEVARQVGNFLLNARLLFKKLILL